MGWQGPAWLCNSSVGVITRSVCVPVPPTPPHNLPLEAALQGGMGGAPCLLCPTHSKHCLQSHSPRPRTGSSAHSRRQEGLWQGNSLSHGEAAMPTRLRGAARVALGLAAHRHCSGRLQLLSTGQVWVWGHEWGPAGSQHSSSAGHLKGRRQLCRHCGSATPHVGITCHPKPLDLFYVHSSIFCFHLARQRRQRKSTLDASGDEMNQLCKPKSFSPCYTAGWSCRLAGAVCNGLQRGT